MAGFFVNHIHVFPPELWPGAGPGDMATLAADLGIDGGVFFAPFSYRWPGGDPNGWLARELLHYPTFAGFGTLDPAKPARDQVMRASDLGLRGIKLHAAAQHFPLNCDWIMEGYAQMERLGMVADFHLGVHGYRIREYHPLLLDDVAHRFPELPMVLEHVGGWHFVRDAVAVIANHTTSEKGYLYAGIASVLDRVRQKEWYLGPTGVADLVWQIGAEHMIYGTDFPYNGRDEIARDLADLQTMDLPPASQAAILGDNLRALLGPDYTA
jgi:predicted TIM-barrel fold metal-dependent hydrolase